MSERKRKKTKRNWTPLAILGFIGLVTIGMASAALTQNWRASQIVSDGGAEYLSTAERLYLQALLTPREKELMAPAGRLTSDTEFEIDSGQGASAVAQNLVAAGLLQDADLFLNYARYYGYDRQLEAGFFIIPPGASTADLAVLLTDARDPFVTVTFIEGMRMEEMTENLAERLPGQIDPVLFDSIIHKRTLIDFSRYDFEAALEAEPTLEGFLFPDTYQLPLNATAEDLVHAMLTNFEQQITPAMRQAYGTRNLSLHEAITLASIVEREAVYDYEKPRVSAVFLNRITQEMMLQADPTVQYAVAQSAGEWWKAPLTVADLETNSPYNTYVTAGLPPGPIANPGRAALEAVAFPEQSNALFFIVDCTSDTPNTHVFSETYEDHLAIFNKCNN